MPTEWFIQKGDRKTGPITSKQLKYMASTGSLLPDALVWKEGMPEPTLASTVPGLFSADSNPESEASVPEKSPPQIKHEKAEGVSNVSSATEWHYALDNEQLGPVSESRLKSLVKSGIVLPTSLVWNETLPDWVPAESIKGLFPSPEITAEEKLPQDSSSAPKENEPPSSPPKASLKDSLLASAKTTAQITAKKAERIKLTSTTLPLLYLKLGRHGLSSAEFRAEFPERFQEIDTIQNQLTELATQPQSDAKTFGEKAKAVAGQAVRTAKSAQLSLQQKKALSQLGRAIYERHLEKSGPEDVVAQIRNALSRVAVLDEEMAELSKNVSTWTDENSTFRSPKVQTAITSLVCLVVIVMCCGVLSPFVKMAREKAREANISGLSPDHSPSSGSTNHAINDGDSPNDDTPSRDSLVKAVYLAAAGVSIQRTLGTGPSPEEFVQLTHEAARQLGADNYDHSRFLLTLEPDRDVTKTVGESEGRVLGYGDETAIFLKNKRTGRYIFFSCSIDGEQKMNLMGR